MDFGIQLYSVKNEMKADVEKTLAALASMGYTMVEPAGFFGVPAADFAAWCKKYGLTVPSSHQKLDDLADGKAEETIAYLKAIGCKRFILASAHTSTKEKLEASIAAIRAAEPLLQANGMELLYHNHAREFMPNEDGIIAHTELQRRTHIRFEIDIYWAYRGGVSPLYVLDQLRDRVPVIHVKDGTWEKGTPLGLGTAPVAASVAYARAHGMGLIVENESDPTRELEEAKICADYLRGLE